MRCLCVFFKHACYLFLHPFLPNSLGPFPFSKIAVINSFLFLLFLSLFILFTVLSSFEYSIFSSLVLFSFLCSSFLFLSISSILLSSGVVFFRTGVSSFWIVLLSSSMIVLKASHVNFPSSAANRLRRLISSSSLLASRTSILSFIGFCCLMCFSLISFLFIFSFALTIL